jgi:hypothetical protein
VRAARVDQECRTGENIQSKGLWDVLLGFGVPFGPKRRTLTLGVLLVGVLTFFVPLVTTDPPVLGRSQWSVFDMVWHICQRELPPSRYWSLKLIYLPLDCFFIYLLFLSAILLLRFPNLHKQLARISVLGIFLLAEMWQWDKDSFEVTFYGHVSYQNLSSIRHVGFGQLTLVLIAIWGTVLFIATNENLDKGPLAKRVPIGDGPRGSSEPAFIEAEILPPEEHGTNHSRAGDG